MLSHPLVQMQARYRAGEMHEQARRAVLAKAAQRERRAQRQQAARRMPARLGGLTRRGRRAAPAPETL